MFENNLKNQLQDRLIRLSLNVNYINTGDLKNKKLKKTIGEKI
jgi:hypothetical protein